MNPSDTRPRIDLDDDADVQAWARRLDASPEQIRDAVQAVGERADDVELHLKGSRASTTASREEASPSR